VPGRCENAIAPFRPAVGAISGLGRPVHALILAVTNIVLRRLSYRIYPIQAAGEEQEAAYAFELICRPDEEAQMRALMLHGLSGTALALTSLRSEDIEGTDKMKVTARIRGLGRQDQVLEQLVARLC
jgi:putative Mg2+ transporter-C (MgtC) family protein